MKKRLFKSMAAAVAVVMSVPSVPIPAQAASKMSVSSCVISIGDELNLDIKGINEKSGKYTTSKAKIASVTKDGIVSAKKAGDAKITWKKGSKKYPVHFSVSDTSGEKAYEEFFTVQETVDMERFVSLGVVTGKEIPDKVRLDGLFKALDAAFREKNIAKGTIVAIMKEYLPDFQHIETGKSLDSKM